MFSSFEKRMLMYVLDLLDGGGGLKPTKPPPLPLESDIEIPLSWLSIYNYIYIITVLTIMLASIQHYMIKFVSDLRRLVGDFLRVLRFSPPIKLTATI
jgi:hypothetical protein